MKKSYNKSIKLQCATCGAKDSFATDEHTGVITCKKCNRVYSGGYDELVELNQGLIESEVALTKQEILEDLNNDILSIFKKCGFKIK